MPVSWNWNRRHLSPVIMPKYLNSYLARITHSQHDRKNLVANSMQSTVLLSGQPYLTCRLFSSLLTCSGAPEWNRFACGEFSLVALCSWHKTKRFTSLFICQYYLILIHFNFQMIQNPDLQHFKAVIKVYFLHFAVLIYLRLNLLSCFMFLWT